MSSANRWAVWGGAVEKAVRRVAWIVESRERSGGGTVPSGGAAALVAAGSRGAVGEDEGGTG